MISIILMMVYSRTVCHQWETLLNRMLRARPGHFFIMIVMMRVLLMVMVSVMAMVDL